MADVLPETNISEEAEAALAQLSKDPKFQSILQKHLAASKGSTYEDLPITIKKRVRALKNIQLEVTRLEAKFYEEVQRIEAKYQALYQPLFDKREQILTGAYEPSPDETKWTLSEDEDEEDEEKPKPVTNGDDNGDDSAVKDKESLITNGTKESDTDSGKGVPGFWLTALRNIDVFNEYIMDHDEAILEHLTDIKLTYADERGLDFTLDFHFSDNEYFTNNVLTKKYTVSCEVSPDDPFGFEGPTITEVKGCKIDWKKGKNVTVKTVKKKQKNKGKGQSRVVTKTVPNESFFNFFSPPDPNTFDSMEETEAADLSMQLEGDMSRAEFIRDRLIPKAVLYFTGDLIDEEEGESMYDEDDDEDDSDPEADEYNASSDIQKAKPPECKQQ
ncbi:PREDICTED: nucleosome assembly protein 1-like 1 [Amphimedon queenslandica]|uniref:Nucleosome assembly protein 1-like 1 n=1 Tax=Amphimedon queenslandica TaxID=400682 RepID=A0A1X7V4C2_AMPQE|nr:PREDICTED: nucleosome assembly protein 1-like 1 [Amphimedon queenslandica]|eukprot:XP_003385626.1 PREDICTED: nucleosome assembly protein 1-like 1 [Amphimedon queenslandica]